MFRSIAILVGSAVFATPAFAQWSGPPVQEAEWTAYAQRFVDDGGRIIDDANGGISHSEGQGYGMLLALLADNRADFERIWSFTRTHLMLRDDGLFVWKWLPDSQPPVPDPNNAADGDILIAYALALAGGQWNEERYLTHAREIATALVRHSIYQWEEEFLISPGTGGFAEQDRPDGPVVNLSYWVLEALPLLEQLAPEGEWDQIADSGLELLRRSAFSDRNLPPDWLSVPRLAPAEGFPARFSYDAMRIPFYMVRAREDDEELLARMREGMTGPGGGIVPVDLESGEAGAELLDSGYRIIPALISCALDGASLPDELLTFDPTVYYPSTLHLLSLAHVRTERPECLG